MTWKTGDADEFLEDIMTEHVHKWRFYRASWSYETMARCTVKGCNESLDGDEVTRRLNATERLSAKVARRNGVILRLGADRVSYGKQTQGYGDNLDLMAYADILEGKDD